MDTELDEELSKQSKQGQKNRIKDNQNRYQSNLSTIPEIGQSQLINLYQANFEKKTSQNPNSQKQPQHQEIAASATPTQVSVKSEETDKISEIPNFNHYNMNSHKFSSAKPVNSIIQNTVNIQHLRNTTIGSELQNEENFQRNESDMNIQQQFQDRKSEESSNAPTVCQQLFPIHSYANQIQNESEMFISTMFLQERPTNEQQQQQNQQSSHFQKSPFQMFKKGDEKQQLLNESTVSNYTESMQSVSFQNCQYSPLIDAKKQIITQLYNKKTEQTEQNEQRDLKIPIKNHKSIPKLKIKTQSMPDCRFMHQYMSLKSYKQFQKFETKRKEALRKLGQDSDDSNLSLIEEELNEVVANENNEMKFQNFNATNFNMSTLKLQK